MFYPLNIFFLLPFHLGWTILIISQPLLAGLFTFLFLKNLKIDEKAAFLGSVIFSFGGFAVVWLEWGNILSTGLWLPLILLSIDRILGSKKNYLWFAILLFGSLASFFAGHLQTFFYLSFLSLAYLLFRWFEKGRKLGQLISFGAICLSFFILSAIQWIPSLNFIFLSGRELDQINWNTEGWFIPWQHLIQFIIPDFFGNPTTLNYWGVWNYAEFQGYIGIFPFAMAALGVFLRRDKLVMFFLVVTLVSLIFSLPTALAKLPYMLEVPFISTSQPTRLLFLISFSLSVLSALGFDHLIREKSKRALYPFILIGSLFILIFFLMNSGVFVTESQNLAVAKRNMVFPFGIFIASVVLVAFSIFFKNKSLRNIIVLGLVVLTMVDLFRFGWKFTPFTPKEYLFPNTKMIEFLQKNTGNFRIMTTDSRILPPNFSIQYRLQSVEGYDPLYLRRYGELVSAIQRNKADINPPFDFNRIITPHDPTSKLIDLLGVKYVLSIDEHSLPKLEKVFTEGQTKVYENKDVLPRAFFVRKIFVSRSREESIKMVMDEKFDPRAEAVVEGVKNTDGLSTGSVDVLAYSENRIVLKTKNKGEGFLILTDIFYPSWRAKVDNGSEIEVYISDFALRGIFVPKGEHTVEFYATFL